MIVGMLGQTIFMTSSKYVLTINDFSKNKSVNWIEHKIIGKEPKLQFDGANLDTLKFNLYLSYALGVNPFATAQKMEELMKNGAVVNFILGQKYLGKYVITDMSETPRAYSREGISINVDVNISLKRYN